ncbi:hypothetical protein CZ765_02275 [Corynebacterium casei]|nr:hypothetical protein CZ765_02275 [Corynebacterium casei]
MFAYKALAAVAAAVIVAAAAAQTAVVAAVAAPVADGPAAWTSRGSAAGTR